MITLHHLEKSQSFRIIWLLEELAVPYELKTYQRDPISSLAPAAYKSLHSAGTAPVITDGEITLAETNAIIDYILDRYPNHPLRPPVNSPQRVPYLYWLHAAQGSLMPMLLMLFVFGRMTEKSPALLRPVIRKITEKTAQVLPLPRIERLLKQINDELAKSAYLAGDTLTAADVVMGYNLVAIESRMVQFDLAKDFPNVAEYLQRLNARPAYQAARQKSGEIV